MKMITVIMISVNATLADHRRLGAILRELRRDKDLTQKELATILRIHQSRVSAIESGQRRVQFVECIEICTALGTTVEALATQLERNQ